MVNDILPGLQQIQYVLSSGGGSTRLHVPMQVVDKAISPIKLNIFRSILFSPFDTQNTYSVAAFVVSKINNARNIRIYIEVEMRHSTKRVELFFFLFFSLHLFRFHFALIQLNARK